jgi:carbon starvation protein
VSTVLIALVVLALFLIAYHTYGRFFSHRILGLDPEVSTPAHRHRDGVDFVPANKYVLFGHHFASIAGVGPILGPAIAVIYGWVPALLWIVVGAIFIGGVHDLGALAASVRHQGRSIGDLTEELVGHRARNLFLLLAFFLLAVVLAVFAITMVTLFRQCPESVFPSFALIVIAVLVGLLMYRTKIGLPGATAIGLVLFVLAIWYGTGHPMGEMLSRNSWAWLLVLFAYAFVASVLPVWVLLQPRDYLNSFGLYAGLGLMYIGLFVARPAIVAPAVRLAPPGAPPIFPFIFILIMCGAISGFHSLVSSGTTSKQLNTEKDARFVGYGSMLVEGALAAVVVLACTAGLPSAEAWQVRYANWATAQSLGAKLSAFVDGAAYFISHIGFSETVAKTFVTVTVIGFALTSLDTATRLLRFIVAEVGERARLAPLKNRFVASAVAVALPVILATAKFKNQSTGMALVPVFGISNQVFACLVLLVVSVFLLHRKRMTVYTLLPMVFMLGITLAAMIIKIGDWVDERNLLLITIGSIILIGEIWLVVEGLLVFSRRHLVTSSGTAGGK